MSHRFSFRNFAFLAAILIGIYFLAYEHLSTPAERIEREAKLAAKYAKLIRNNRWWTAPGLWLRLPFNPKGTDPAQHYFDIYWRCESNLVTLGALEKRNFYLQHTNRITPAVIDQNFRSDDFLWSCSFSTPTSIVVTTRPSQMQRWERLVKEYDKAP